MMSAQTWAQALMVTRSLRLTIMPTLTMAAMAAWMQMMISPMRRDTSALTSSLIAAWTAMIEQKLAQASSRPTSKRTVGDDLQALLLQFQADIKDELEASMVMARGKPSHSLGDFEGLGEREGRERKESEEESVRARVHL